MTGKYDSFRPGQEWHDTSGHPIQAHGGSLIEKDGVFYWYGENKERTTGKDDRLALGNPLLLLDRLVQLA